MTPYDLDRKAWRKTWNRIFPLMMALMTGSLASMDFHEPYWRRVVTCVSVGILVAIAGLCSATILHQEILRKLMVKRHARASGTAGAGAGSSADSSSE